MSDNLEKVLERVRAWPEARQQDVVRILEAMEQSGMTPYYLMNEERDAIQVGLNQADQNEFVGDAEMDAFWQRNRA